MAHYGRGLKSGSKFVVVGPGLKLGVVNPKVQQTKACSTGLRVSLVKFFNYTQIVLFLKSHPFGNCSHLIFLYIIGYNNIP